jgi:hypothetical protein
MRLQTSGRYRAMQFKSALYRSVQACTSRCGCEQAAATGRCGSKAPCTGRYRPVPAGAAPNEQRQRPVQYMTMRFQSALCRSVQAGTSRCGCKQAAARGRCSSKAPCTGRYRPVPADAVANKRPLQGDAVQKRPVPVGTGLYQPVRLQTSSECRPGSSGTVPFAVGRTCTSQYRQKPAKC